MNRPAVRPSETGSATVPRIIYWVAGLLLALQPLADPALWWQIVRGRTVWNGDWRPSQALLINEQLPDADWLCGVIPWVTFLWFGIAGLMLLKLAIAGWAAWQLNPGPNERTESLLIALLILIAIKPAFDPTSVSWDILFALLMWPLIQRGRLLPTAILTIVWANVSVGAIWVLPMLVCQAPVRNAATWRTLMLWLAVLAGALSLTPRGLSTLTDMLSLLLPWLFQDAVFLSGTHFAPVSLTLPVAAAGLLFVLAIASPTTWGFQKAILAVVAACGLLTVRHLPVAAIICGLILVETCRRNTPAFRLQPVIGGTLVLAVLGVVVWDASGGIDGTSERLGWGMADSVDYRYTERDLEQHRSSTLKAHCTDVVGAGMLLLTCPDVQMLDVSDAAICRHRMPALWLLNHDLSTGRKPAYTRQDGSAGGWWRALIHRDISLLVVSSGRESTLTSLEPTLWKPLSLDAPSLVFAAAGTRQFNAQILNAQLQRDAVEVGEWRHELYAESAVQSHIDFWRSVTGIADARSDLRQARTFLAMQLPIGAVRTLAPVLRNHCHPDGRAEFHKVQQHLAWDEWLHCGAVSDLRYQVLQEFDTPVTVAHRTGRDLRPDPSSELPLSVIPLYCSGQPAAAAQAIDRSTIESLYAQHILFFEAGQGAAADAAFRRMQTLFPEHPLTMLSGLLRDAQSLAN